MQLAFKANAGDHSQLFTRLCDVSLGRDSNAPVNISPEEELQFENRKGIIQLRNAIKTTTDSKQRAGLRTKLKGLLKTLGQLQLQLKRTEYFKKADYLGAQGHSTNGICMPGKKTSLQPAIARISLLFDFHIEEKATDYTRRSRRLSGISTGCRPDFREWRWTFFQSSPCPPNVSGSSPLRERWRIVDGLVWMATL
ncbi:hypothetical protein F5Y17DRAFT_202015 [Xylariaceae sp. FL0594]|nr:hypothetical protein F5Y17DRAFT_202015 [Xylariaceae sp. FL0594]